MFGECRFVKEIKLIARDITEFKEAYRKIKNLNLNYNPVIIIFTLFTFFDVVVDQIPSLIINMRMDLPCIGIIS